jgi:HAMP domain-containing protein
MQSLLILKYIGKFNKSLLNGCDGWLALAEHQVSHWKAGHKQECPRLAAAASATSASAASSAQLPQQRPAAAVASGRPPVAAPATEAEVAAAVEAFERFARSLQREAGGGEDDDSRRAFVIRDEVEGKGRAAFAVRDIAQFRHPTTPLYSLIVRLTRHDTTRPTTRHDQRHDTTRHAQR